MSSIDRRKLKARLEIFNALVCRGGPTRAWLLFCCEPWRGVRRGLSARKCLLPARLARPNAKPFLPRHRRWHSHVRGVEPGSALPIVARRLLGADALRPMRGLRVLAIRHNPDPECDANVPRERANPTRQTANARP